MQGSFCHYCGFIVILQTRISYHLFLSFDYIYFHLLLVKCQLCNSVVLLRAQGKFLLRRKTRPSKKCRQVSGPPKSVDKYKFPLLCILTNISAKSHPNGNEKLLYLGMGCIWVSLIASNVEHFPNIRWSFICLFFFFLRLLSFLIHVFTEVIILFFAVFFS